MVRTPEDDLIERKKYIRLWDTHEYRQCSPAEDRVMEIMLKLPNKGIQTIDFGCGTGRAALILHCFGYDVLLVDFAPNCRDEAAKDLPFFQWSLTQPFPVPLRAQGYCVDVMEHIHPDDVSIVLQNILRVSALTYFQISTRPDSFGKRIGETLHLTVKPTEWWMDTLKAAGAEIVWQIASAGDCRFLVRSRP